MSWSSHEASRGRCYTELRGWRQIQRIRDVSPSIPGLSFGQNDRLRRRWPGLCVRGMSRPQGPAGRALRQTGLGRCASPCESDEGTVGDTTTRRWAFATSRRRTSAKSCLADRREQGPTESRAGDGSSIAAPARPGARSASCPRRRVRERLLGNGYAMRLLAAPAQLPPIDERSEKRRGGGTEHGPDSPSFNAPTREPTRKEIDVKIARSHAPARCPEGPHVGRCACTDASAHHEEASSVGQARRSASRSGPATTVRALSGARLRA